MFNWLKQQITDIEEEAKREALAKSDQVSLEIAQDILNNPTPYMQSCPPRVWCMVLENLAVESDANE